MNHVLIQGILDFIREDASRKARYTLLYATFTSTSEYISVNVHVVMEKLELQPHVLEQSTNHGCKVNDMRRAILSKDGFGVFRD